MVCADYTDHPLESTQLNTNVYVYDEATKCSGTSTRKCYIKTGCNANKGYYDTSEACLTANSCYSDCVKDSTYKDCYVINTPKTCAYDNGHTWASCNTSCFNCDDKEEYCGIKYCYNPSALSCRGDYPLGKCPADHTCDSGTVSVGNASTGACTNTICYKDNGCDESKRRYASEARCLEKEPGYSSCQQLDSGCWTYKDAKTCASYGMTDSCDGDCYNCPSDKQLLGEKKETCYSPSAKTCGSYSMSDSCSSDCYNCPSDSKCTGDHNSTCYSPSLKTCGELGYYGSDEACVNANSGYKCTDVSLCSNLRTCYKTNGCDSSHCGTDCGTESNSCKTTTYPYTPSTLPANSDGTGACYPACQTDNTTRYSGFECKSGYTKYNGACHNCQEYTTANGWYKGSNKPSDASTVCYSTSTATCAGTTYTHYSKMSTSCDISQVFHYTSTNSGYFMYAWFDRKKPYRFSYAWSGMPSCECQFDVTEGPTVYGYGYPIKNITDCPLGLYKQNGSNSIPEYASYVNLPSGVSCEGFWGADTACYMGRHAAVYYGGGTDFSWHDDEWGYGTLGNYSNCDYFNNQHASGDGTQTCVTDPYLAWDGVNGEFRGATIRGYTNPNWPCYGRECVQCDTNGWKCVWPEEVYLGCDWGNLSHCDESICN